MDFGELLHTAKKNEQSKSQIQYYSTKFTPPKKEQRSKNISVNVQKFLARKEAEEKQKREEALERKNKLLALRSQDKKATRRVNVMLKRTKSANQSVIADALDIDNTAVTLAGPSQPDEDDYGYVSQESSALYNKMMEKYNKMPEEPKFSEGRKKVNTNLSSTKDRVRAALEREKEEALLPHRRKRKHVDNGGDTEKSVERNMELEPEPEEKDSVKPKFKAAPLVNFSDLLKLAEKKQFEPVIVETRKEEEERPLTKKQKKEMEREREWRERKESQKKAPRDRISTISKIPKESIMTPQTIEKVRKKTTAEDQELDKTQKTNEIATSRQNVKSLDRNSNIMKINKAFNKTSKLDVITDKKQIPNKSELSKKSDFPQKSLNGFKNPNVQHIEKPKVVYKHLSPPIPQKPKSSIQNEKPKALQIKDLQKKNSTIGSKVKSSIEENEDRIKQISLNSLISKQFPPNDLKSKQLPPRDLKPKEFQPAPKKNVPLKDSKKKLIPNRRRIIDDEEYDSEMDDFIDDGPEDGQDYSKYISEIFGYDKQKYVYEDDDVDNMESSFAQQMKEEVISTKIGIMEDLEDIRQEEEARKKKLIMKKRKKL